MSYDWQKIKIRIASNPELKARRAKQHYEHRIRLRKEVLSRYGNMCACCGEKESRFLCIDHVFGGGNLDRKSFKGPLYYRIKREGFPKEYQVLCHNCNWAKSHGGCPHGTPAGQLQVRSKGML